VRTFVDTNVWVYAADEAEPSKMSRARSVLGDLAPADVVISAQVLSEYHVTVTQKLASPMTHDEAARAVHTKARFEVVPVTASLVQSAIDRQRQNALSFWDALILEAARVARCQLLLTEDLHDGQVLDGLEIRDPFL
jgi:predicted nucleic acid-binding protein